MEDILGAPLFVKDVVVFCDHNRLCFGTVMKFGAKMIKIQHLGPTDKTVNRYPNDCLKIENKSTITFWLLRQRGKKHVYNFHRK